VRAIAKIGESDCQNCQNRVIAKIEDQIFFQPAWAEIGEAPEY
jgi:hypothetical protein